MIILLINRKIIHTHLYEILFLHEQELKVCPIYIYMYFTLDLNHIISNCGTYIAISLNFALSIFTLRSADTRKGLSLDFDLDRDLDFDLDFLR